MEYTSSEELIKYVLEVYDEEIENEENNKWLSTADLNTPDVVKGLAEIKNTTLQHDIVTDNKNKCGF